MAIQKPVKVPKAKITSIDIVSFDGGLDQRGAANIRSNNYSVGRNVMVDGQGLATHRYGLKRWLPDTVGKVYQVFPALYKGDVYYIVADDGKIKYIKDGDTSWTDATGSNTVTTTGKAVNTFIRVLDNVLILNGVDELGYLDLSDMKVVHYTPIADPATKPTTSATGLTGSDHKVYYSITYNSVVGQTKTSPIATQNVKKIREQWKPDGSENVTITDPNTRPAGATSWNLYVATAASGGTIKPVDMLPLVLGLDINTTTFTDEGKIEVNLSGGTAPEDNGTKGPKAKYGIEIEGRPFLYGITDDEYAIRIGGANDHAMDFSPNNGGYRLELNKGTNYYPMSVAGFRSGQGTPSITVLYSNTEGQSKQSIIEQNTVTYGNFSFVVWGSTEQNHGAAGVSSPYGVINYKGALRFPTTDGFLRMDTQASLQNVLASERISDPVINEIGSIKVDKYDQIVGTAWANRVLWSIPARGFLENNTIIVCDVSRKDVEAWSTFDLAAQWLGVVSPPESSAFIYACQGNKIFRLQKVYVAQDEIGDGLTQAFPVQLETALVGTNTAHNGFYAIVQVVFYLLDFIGEIDLSVTWRDYRSGRMKTKTKTITNGAYAKSSDGNWSSPGYMFNQNIPQEAPLRWGDVAPISDAQGAQKRSIRTRVRLNNVVTNELKASFSVNLDNSAFTARSISFEGQNLGSSPDIR